MAKKKNAEQLVYGEPHGDAPKEIKAWPFYDVTLDEDQLKFVNAVWNPDIDIVFCNAKAGSGKTFCATGVANLLVKYGFYKGITYIMVPYGERKQGWLPGTITEKSSVYFEPFYQALIKCNINPNTAINDESMTNQKNGTGFITTITDTFLRGSNIDDCVLILDEIQNASVSQLKKILTRVGTKTKVIAIGHTLQCDLDDPSKSGFDDYIEHFRGMPRAAVCELTINHRGWISQHADDLEER